MSELNNDWVKKGYPQTTTNKCTIPFNTSDCLQKHISPNPFSSLKRKYNTKNSIKIDTKIINDDLSTCRSSEKKSHHCITESIKPEGSALNYPHQIKEENSQKHLNMYSDTSKENNNKHSNIFFTKLNSINLNSLNRKHAELIISNDKPSLKNNIHSTDSWREINYADKLRLAWISYLNSLTGAKIIPIVTLKTIANPFMLIPIEVSRMANHINLNMAEVLCRKRTETAVIYWIVSKLN